MTPTLASIWRHPIKAHGREQVAQITVEAGRCLPWDRAWAVTHEASKPGNGEWIRCSNFSRGAKAPQLMALTSSVDETTGIVTLRHPEKTDLSIDPATEQAAFLEWITPLMPTDRAASTGLMRATEQGMTDSAFPSVSLNSLSSLGALGAACGQTLSQHRFRGNLWIDGLAPWAEFDWIGRSVRIGEVVIEVREKIGRCLATATNTETGQRDVDTLGVLKTNWGHTDFGVYGVITQGGILRNGVRVQVL